MSSNQGKRTISIGSGEEHRAVRGALRSIRACVKDPGRRERVEAELIAAMLSEGTLKPEPDPESAG